MITVFSEEHLMRNAKTELYGGRLVPPHECPERAQIVLERVRAVGLGEVMPPARFGLDPGPQGPRRAVRRIPGERLARTGPPPATWARRSPIAGRPGA